MCTSFLTGFGTQGEENMLKFFLWLRDSFSAILLGIVKAKHIGKFDFFKFKIALWILTLSDWFI
jgi:hypothetical protein